MQLVIYPQALWIKYLRKNIVGDGPLDIPKAAISKAGRRRRRPLHRIGGLPRRFAPRNDIRLQAGIDIGCNVPNVVLQGNIALVQYFFYLINGVHDSGVVLTKLLANVRQAQIGKHPN